MENYLYGTIGGIVGTVFSHPFDTIRIRHQLKLPLNISYNSYKTQNVKNFYPRYLFTNLYKGITSPLFGIGLEKTIIFGVYNQLLNKTNNKYLSAYVAGLTSCLIVTPVEKIKIHFQTNNNNNNTKFIFKNIYKGFIPTLFREPPGYVIYFYSYDKLVLFHKKYFNTQYINNYSIFLYGGLSGCASWVFIYPVDHIKTIKQKYDYSIYKTHDFILSKKYNYYNGFSLALMRAFPLHAGVFLGFELCKKYLTVQV